jgi:hypothetical protein
MSIFTGIAEAATGIEPLADWERPSRWCTWAAHVPCEGEVVPDEMAGGQVTELGIRVEGESIVLGNSDSDCLIEVDDPIMGGGWPDGGEQTDDEFFVVGKFGGPVRVDVKDGTLGGGESDGPVSMRLD